jgi:hypothetical protein
MMINREHIATEIWETLTEKPEMKSEAAFVPVMS